MKYFSKIFLSIDFKLKYLIKFIFRELWLLLFSFGKRGFLLEIGLELIDGFKEESLSEAFPVNDTLLLNKEITINSF